MSYDSNDVKQVEKKKDIAELNAQSDVDDLISIMRTEHGRRFMWELLKRCHVFHSSYIVGDVNMTIFREGERNVGLSIVDSIQRNAPGLYSQMTEEGIKNDRRRKQ